MLCLVAQSCLTLCDLVDSRLPGSSVHGDSPGKNTGVGCHALLQGIFSTQGSNLGLLHCRQILYCLNHQGNQGNYGVLCLVTQLCPTLCDPVDCSLPGFSVHGDSPGKNHRVGCHALLQGIFSTQGSNLVFKAIYILYKTCSFSTKHSPTTQNFSHLYMSSSPQLSTVRLSQHPTHSRISA